VRERRLGRARLSELSMPMKMDVSQADVHGTRL